MVGGAAVQAAIEEVCGWIASDCRVGWIADAGQVEQRPGVSGISSIACILERQAATL
ncbi:hypothetical protein [Azospirillum endophyticum]